jgi:hypothetical protein
VQRAGAVRGDQLDIVKLAQSVLERLVGQPRGLELVEDLEPRIDSRRQRVRAKDTGTESVDRGDEGPLGRAGFLHRPELPQPVSDSLAQLGGGLIGEGDRQDRPDLDPVLEHRSSEPLDKN